MAFAPDRPAVLMTVAGEAQPMTLARAAEILAVALDALDPDFGVVLVSPHRNIYAVRVDAATIGSGESGENGPFSDPPIAPTR